MSDDPAPASVSRSRLPLRQLTVRRTPARDRCYKLLPQALREGWSARRLAKEADTTDMVASDILATTSQQMQANVSKVIGAESNKLAQEARKARESAIKRLESLSGIVDSATQSLQAKGSQASAKDVKEVIAAASQLWKHVESLTGLDVAKVAATRQAVASNEQVTSWDGVAALEAMPCDD